MAAPPDHVRELARVAPAPAPAAQLACATGPDRMMEPRVHVGELLAVMLVACTSARPVASSPPTHADVRRSEPPPITKSVDPSPSAEPPSSAAGPPPVTESPSTGTPAAEEPVPHVVDVQMDGLDSLHIDVRWIHHNATEPVATASLTVVTGLGECDDVTPVTSVVDEHAHLHTVQAICDRRNGRTYATALLRVGEPGDASIEHETKGHSRIRGSCLTYDIGVYRALDDHTVAAMREYGDRDFSDDGSCLEDPENEREDARIELSR